MKIYFKDVLNVYLSKGFLVRIEKVNIKAIEIYLELQLDFTLQTGNSTYKIVWSPS